MLNENILKIDDVLKTKLKEERHASIKLITNTGISKLIYPSVALFYSGLSVFFLTRNTRLLLGTRAILTFLCSSISASLLSALFEFTDSFINRARCYLGLTTNKDHNVRMENEIRENFRYEIGKLICKMPIKRALDDDFKNDQNAFFLAAVRARYNYLKHKLKFHLNPKKYKEDLIENHFTNFHVKPRNKDK